ncbi:MAG: beta-class carbonic anhydrase [Acidimicrobiales bacterium]
MTGGAGDAFADLLAANDAYAASFALGGLEARAAKGLALVTCIDSRIEPLAALGLVPGDAKILRNAGGRVTSDVVRSRAVAPALLGVERVAVMHHSRCAMAGMAEPALRGAVVAAGAELPDGCDLLAMDDPGAALLEDVRCVRESPMVRPGVVVTGWRYDVETGRVTVEVP